jgi:hypothetical protein
MEPQREWPAPTLPTCGGCCQHDKAVRTGRDGPARPTLPRSSTRISGTTGKHGKRRRAAGWRAKAAPLGNLSGFAGPYAMGYLKDLTGNFTIGLLLLAGCAVLGAAIVSRLRIDVKREHLSGEISLAAH